MSNLIWIDLEMTGLDVAKDTIIEIATIVTDSQLNVLAEGPAIAIHHGDEVLNNMNEWCIKQHGASGLTERCQKSTTTMEQAEDATIKFLEQWVKKNTSPMCGNSVWNDRKFMCKYMPKLEEFFHYRMLDVSTLKELAKRWRPDLIKNEKKESKHLAMDDILESIAELGYYRSHFLNLDALAPIQCDEKQEQK